jgi:hypothetical protein
MKIGFSIIQIFVLLAAGRIYGQGIIIAQHSGFNNPTTEGFISEGETPGRGVTNDLGYNAWSTPGLVGYYTPISNIANVDWILSVIVRIAATNAWPDQFVVYIGSGSGSSSIPLYFGSDGDGNPIVSVGGTNFVLSGGSIYDNYQLIYSAETQTASFWINGIEELPGIIVQNESSFDILTFDDPIQEAGQANWNLVSLEVVPEPSVWSLIVLGGGIFIYVRRQFQTKRRL